MFLSIVFFIEVQQYCVCLCVASENFCLECYHRHVLSFFFIEVQHYCGVCVGVCSERRALASRICRPSEKHGVLAAVGGGSVVTVMVISCTGLTDVEKVVVPAVTPRVVAVMIFFILEQTIARIVRLVPVPEFHIDYE